MGFDKPVNQDHSYLDDPSDTVAMNVEIIEENNYQVAQNNVVEKPVIRYIVKSGSSNTKMDKSFEDTNRYSKKALIYLPYSEFCTEHKDLFLHEDEKLVKPGDKFASHDDFVQYLNENAKRWCFYYRCSDSRKPNTGSETYTYNCVYLRNKEKYKKKGIRKRNNNMKTDCPCKIKLRHLPNERELTVIYVCNHHDHELSLNEFYKLQHGRRLPPYVKEEIKDFLQLKVDIMKIKAYVEMETGFTMSRPFFYALEKNMMKNKEVHRHISEQRLALLKQKLAAVDEMLGYNEDQNEDEQAQQVQNHADDDIEISKNIINRRSLKNAEKARRTPPKRRSIGNIRVTSSDETKRIKVEGHSEKSFKNETLQSVKHLNAYPWIADQCVPVLPNRTVIKVEDSADTQGEEQIDEELRILAQSKVENMNYTIEYDDENHHAIISNEFGEIIHDGQAILRIEENDINNIAYETVVTNENDETQTEGNEYVDHDQTIEESIVVQTDAQEVDDQTEVLDEDFDNTQNEVEEENHVEYITENVEENNEEGNHVEYITETVEETAENNVQYVTENVEGDEGEVEYLEEEFNDEQSAQEIGVQTTENANKTVHSLLPVFDVYMKDGNVTGFVVNDNLITGLKDGVDKEIQTTAEIRTSDIQDPDHDDVIDGEIIHHITNKKSENTYTKHEYVHRYNIDKYMVQPHFPKYIETLAKETYMDVLQMFTNIYNEKAMFKITTTQKGKEGNTRIWYIKDTHRTKKRRYDETHKDKLGENLQSIFILKEKLRYMKKKNSELLIKNKHLEDVALRLAKSVRD